MPRRSQSNAHRSPHPVLRCPLMENFFNHHHRAQTDSMPLDASSLHSHIANWANCSTIMNRLFIIFLQKLIRCSKPPFYGRHLCQRHWAKLVCGHCLFAVITRAVCDLLFAMFTCVGACDAHVLGSISYPILSTRLCVRMERRSLNGLAWLNKSLFLWCALLMPAHRSTGAIGNEVQLAFECLF